MGSTFPLDVRCFVSFLLLVELSSNFILVAFYLIIYHFFNCFHFRIIMLYTFLIAILNSFSCLSHRWVLNFVSACSGILENDIIVCIDRRILSFSVITFSLKFFPLFLSTEKFLSCLLSKKG